MFENLQISGWARTTGDCSKNGWPIVALLSEVGAPSCENSATVTCDGYFQDGTKRIRAAAWLAWLLCGMIFSTGAVARAEDWPTYRHDAARSGVTSERIRVPLVESWVFRARHAPEPAWGDPKSEPVEDILELRRNHFDDVFQPVVAGGAVYFGSSAENKITSLDAATGKTRWTKILGGPVRLAPTVAGPRVYVGSDDGHAYCLHVKDGSILWQFRAAPEDRRVLGHGKMISLWPLRTGVLVDGEVAYFSAGIFPAEGVFFYAVDVADGREIWRNDACGEPAQSKISPQGYLLASKSTLYAPMGRASPAALDRTNGRLLYGPPFFGKTVGGTYALLAGDDLFTGTEQMVGYLAKTRDRFATFPGRKMIVAGPTAYLASDSHLTAMDRAKNWSVRWKMACRCHDALILAHNTLLAGGPNQVVAVDVSSGKQVFSAKVDGAAKGLAVADGRLLVSTDKGMIYCFAPEGTPQHAVVTEPSVENPYPDSPTATLFEEAAQTVLSQTGIKRGYCLILGLKTGQLALELARRSELMIYAVSPDAEQVAAVRKKLNAAGVYGTRVCVEQWPLDKVPYSDYFANLIVSETAMVSGQFPGEFKKTCRMLKPLGGTLMEGSPTVLVKSADPPEGKGWTVQRVELGDQGRWRKIVRGPLPGAGNWTHLYGNTGNTASGDDRTVKCPLGVLWFGDPGPGRMVNRHARAAGPVSLDGRLFVQGENVVMAYDAYNGLRLWQRDLPGAMRIIASHDCSNLAVSREGLFVAVADRCLRLDPATGETKATYQMPADPYNRPRSWGYVACVGKLLYGSRTPNMRFSDCLFAVDVDSGEVRWTYDGKQIPNNTFSIGDGRVYLVSSDVADEQRQAAIDEERRRIKDLPDRQRKKTEKLLARADVRMVVALDAKTGKPQWEKPFELNRSVGKSKSGSMTQAAMYHNGVLVLFGMYLDGHYWEQFFAGQFDTRRITAVAGEDGKLLWSKLIGYRVRPLILGDTLHAEPWAFDLHTGEQKMRIHPVTGLPDPWQFARPGHHCGLPVASANCLFFRSLTLGYYDLAGDYGTMHFGAQRPGCWINFIPAAGLLLMPEASTGCMCTFPNMCSVALKPTEKNKAWAWYSAPGPMTPVKRLAINFGAPGDRRDASGKLWLGFPRPYPGRLVLPLDVEASFWSGGSFVTRNSVYDPVAGTGDPWLFASAAHGLRTCEIPLLDKGDGVALYRVRLAFADPEHNEPGGRVFDVKLQGKAVQENFDIAREAGGRKRAVFKDFQDVEVSEDLAIELVPNSASPAPQQRPILQGVEIVRQRFIAPGCYMPELLISHLSPKQSTQLKLANLCEDPFQGTLRLEMPDGFEVSPKQVEVHLASGQRTVVPVELRVGKDTPAGDYRLTTKLVRPDGSIKLATSVRIEHLGRRGRVVLRPVEDVSIHRRFPRRNRGSASTLLIDGGHETLGDFDHALAYLKFQIDVPGKPVSLRLRITNAGNPTSDSGRICRVAGPWSERTLTYETRPKTGEELARLGAVRENQVIEVPLTVELDGRSELSLVFDPTSCDGTTYLSRETTQPPELIVEYVP